MSLYQVHRQIQVLSGDGQRFISSVLFVDGHSATYDFTYALEDDSDYPLEPTKDWFV